jgi:hypothetical protein
MDITIIKFTIHYPAKTRKICRICKRKRLLILLVILVLIRICKRKRYVAFLEPEVLLSGSHIMWSCLYSGV